MTLYSGPEDASAFEVITAYRKLLQSDEFDILFSCENAACCGQFLEAFYNLAPFANDPGWNNSSPITQGNPDTSYVLVAKSENEGKTMYVSLIVSQGWWSYPVYKLDIAEVQEFEGKISSVTGPGEDTADDAREPSGTPAAERAPRRPVRSCPAIPTSAYCSIRIGSSCRQRLRPFSMTGIQVVTIPTRS